MRFDGYIRVSDTKGRSGERFLSRRHPARHDPVPCCEAMRATRRRSCQADAAHRMGSSSPLICLSREAVAGKSERPRRDRLRRSTAPPEGETAARTRLTLPGKPLRCA